MQIENPSEGEYNMPVAWYFAPPGAKTIDVPNAFGSGNWDRDKPALPTQLGAQPPYAYPYYSGENVWGYVGQCRIGTDDQFASGLSAADLSAPVTPVPRCCATPRTGQTWFFRSDLKPPQSIQPAGFVGPWTNIGAPTVARLLSNVPGKAVQNLPYSDPDISIPMIHQVGVIQYITAPLPAQTIVQQMWSCRMGWSVTALGLQGGFRGFAFLIDGTTGLPKLRLDFASFLGPNLLMGQGSAAEGFVRLLRQADVVYGDYLCLEFGWTYAAIPPVPHRHLTALIRDGGNLPIKQLFGQNFSPMSLLQWPPDGDDADMPLTGTVLAFAAGGVPLGYLPCDGTLRNIADFPALFSAIGATWGAAPPGTFLLPDLRDRTLVGVSPGALGPDRPGVRIAGQAGGEEKHLLAVGELPAHTHGLTALQANYGLVPGAGGIPLDSTGDDGTPAVSAAAGGGLASNVMQPFGVIQWIVKT